VSENRVLRIIFGPKLDKVTWDRRMHNMELCCYLGDQIKKKMGGAYEGEDWCIQGVCAEKCGKETTCKTLA
jgi:hypothetical protein